MSKKIAFEGIAKSKPKVKFSDQEQEVSVWTDGLALSADNISPCVMKLEKGKKYRITVEELDNL